MEKPSDISPVCGEKGSGTEIVYDWSPPDNGKYSSTNPSGVKEYKLEIETS
jgi:hypothetical protein